MTLKIKKMSFTDYKNHTITQKDYIDGIVLLGCGGSLEEWIIGVSNELKNQGIVESTDLEILFTDFVELKTSGGRTDLALSFNPKTYFHMGKMAMWRLQFGDCSWVSDYLDNYADQHNESSAVWNENGSYGDDDDEE